MKKNSLLITLLAVLSFCCSCESIRDLFGYDKYLLPDSVIATDDYHVSFTSATIFATYEGETGTEIEFGVSYGTSQDQLTSYEKATVTGEDSSFKVEITGLKPGSRYYFRPVAKNKSNMVSGETVERITFTEGPVDLELPSGLKWAACNLGAELPSDSGKYYSWAETGEKEYYNWYYYMWCDHDIASLTKYNTQPHLGKVDNKTSMDNVDDVAYLSSDGVCRIPTSEEAQELIDNTIPTRKTINGVPGTVLLSSKNPDEENYLFIPEAKYINERRVINGSYFWTSTLSNNSAAAYSASIKGDISYLIASPRYLGEVIRPVYR